MSDSVSDLSEMEKCPKHINYNTINQSKRKNLLEENSTVHFAECTIGTIEFWRSCTYSTVK